jgi:polysaccharide pyruvyl transferase WcaK-like protein
VPQTSASNPVPVESDKPELFYLVGTSGHPNFGDEFIAASWLRFLADRHPDVPVILDCPKPGMAAMLFEGLHPNLRTTDVMWRMVWEVVDLPVEEAATKIDSLFRDLSSPLYDYALLQLRKVTRIHLIGGGHITHHWPAHVQLLRAALTLGELADAPVSSTGLGLTPSSDGEFVREMLSEFDYATVRDQPSSELTGLPVSPTDAVLGLKRLPGFDTRPTAAPAEGEKGEIWVDLQRDLASEDSFETNLGLIRDFLTSDIAQGRTIRYVEAIPGGDRVAFERLSDLIPEENFFPFVRLWSEPFPARPRQIWLTSRFHLHLFAAASGAAGVAFEIDEDYYRAKHQSLIELGTEWSVVKHGSTDPIMPSGGTSFRMVAQRLHRGKLLEAEKIFPRTR